MEASENPLRFTLGRHSRGLAALEVGMSKQLSFWDFEECLGAILAKGEGSAAEAGGDSGFRAVPADP